jgi:hypothetical protein
MKHSAPLFFLIAAGALTAKAHGALITNLFTETIVIGTDTFEQADGSVLFTTNGVGYSDWLSPIIANDLATDPTIPTQVQSTTSLIPEVSELQFLTEQFGGDTPDGLGAEGIALCSVVLGPPFSVPQLP